MRKNEENKGRKDDKGLNPKLKGLNSSEERADIRKNKIKG